MIKSWEDFVQDRINEKTRNSTEETNDFWKKELKKCSLDTSRIYMIEKYVFNNKLWKGQRHLLECMKHRHITFSVKSRAVGYTSLMAALTACEMVLNCDMGPVDVNNDKCDIVYIAQSVNEKQMFIRLVIDYINRIPKQLWTTDCNWSATTRQLHLGYSRLTVTSPGNCGFSTSNDKKPKYVIYDEIVSCQDKFDFYDPLEQHWFDLSDKVIIGSCANHRNEKFYNFVKDYKEKHGCFVKMEWFDNPHHTTYDYTYKRNCCYDQYAFSDEYDCEVFKLTKDII
jgi:hypothetical protein